MKFSRQLLIGLALLWLNAGSVAVAQHESVPDGFRAKLKKANKEITEYALGQQLQHGNELDSQVSGNVRSAHSLHTALSAFRDKMNTYERFFNVPARTLDTAYLGDTLVVGLEPGEELLIESDWLHTGPILVIGDGVLRFSGAHATILGDIVTVQNGQVIADSSYLYLPQDYFYQRILLLTGNSGMHFRNSTLDFGGLVHNMATVDAAVLELDHVVKPDFSTVAMYGESVIVIDSVDVAGEFIIDDDVRLEIKNAETVLLWHQMGEGAVADVSFPDGEYVTRYEFNDQQSGVSGVGYDILLENSAEVWWGLMPSAGSDVTVSDSDIRAIGLWFEGADSTEVNGLVNGVHYGDYTAPVQDRNLHLFNCDVMTWSLYTFDDAYVDVSGCILGEIGVMGRSEVNAMNYFCDGSGGYLWAADTTFMVSAFSSLSAPLRASGLSLTIFAYSVQTNGQVQALEQSILMLLQSNISSAPTFDPGAVVWMEKITGPASAYENETVQVKGAAWIDKGSESVWMDFGYYVMYYRKEGDTNWQMIGDTSYSEAKDGVLINWNTEGVTPGAYLLRLDVWDDQGNGVTATSNFTLLPALLGAPEPAEASLEYTVFPNPVRSVVNFSFTLKEAMLLSLRIYDAKGREVAVVLDQRMSAGSHKTGYNANDLPAGIYYSVLDAGGNTVVKKIIVY